jgi:hypothetical protein
MYFRTSGPFRFASIAPISGSALREIDPVILVVYDAQEDCAFWLYMQPYLEQRSSRGYFGDGKITVRIPTKNRVNRRAIKQFARWRDANREIAVRSKP